MTESASKDIEASAQESQPAEPIVPEGADPGSPTMDYFEKGEKPDGESR
jgi:hypothetical protein